MTKRYRIERCLPEDSNWTAAPFIGNVLHPTWYEAWAHIEAGVRGNERCYRVTPVEVEDEAEPAQPEKLVKNDQAAPTYGVQFVSHGEWEWSGDLPLVYTTAQDAFDDLRLRKPNSLARYRVVNRATGGAVAAQPEAVVQPVPVSDYEELLKRYQDLDRDSAAIFEAQVLACKERDAALRDLANERTHSATMTKMVKIAEARAQAWKANHDAAVEALIEMQSEQLLHECTEEP